MRNSHTAQPRPASTSLRAAMLVSALAIAGLLGGCGNSAGSDGNDTVDFDSINLSDIDVAGLDVDQDILSQLDLKSGDTIGADMQDAKDAGEGTDAADSGGTDAAAGTDATSGADAADTADSGASDIASGCTSTASCDDQNLCTDDKCGGDGACSHTPNAVPCDDGVTCTTDSCAGGKCVGVANDASCTDDNGCTADSCDLASGCTHTASDGACDDGNPCTLSDACTNGVCIGSGVNACDDGNPCTADACALPGGCTHTALDPATQDVLPSCSDNNACTSGDACLGGTCVGQPKNCQDENLCTDDSCNPDTGGCVHLPNAVTCDDGIACSVGDHCVESACAGTLTDSLCDDNNPCTSDWCSTDGGCNHAPADASCTDGNPCTVDVCAGFACVSTPKDCNDGNACTADSCDAVTGNCLAKNIVEGQCTLNDACVVNAGCIEGKCTVMQALVCQDDNLCTDDSCDATTGCVFLANAVTCDDGDLCTDGDHCAAKKCAGAEKVCPASIDSPTCSIGFCDGKTGACTVKFAAWFEDFSRKGKGWKLQGEWQIGLAMASTPVGDVYADPGVDADGATDGYLAGMVIGGNIDNTPHDWYYLTSPVIDLSSFATPTAILDIQAAGQIMGSTSQQTVVEFTGDGQTWVNAETLGDINQTWALLGTDLTIPSPLCTAQFQFRIGYRVITVVDYVAPIVAGLSIDNISIFSGNCW